MILAQVPFEQVDQRAEPRVGRLALIGELDQTPPLSTCPPLSHRHSATGQSKPAAVRPLSEKGAVTSRVNVARELQFRLTQVSSAVQGSSPCAHI